MRWEFILVAVFLSSVGLVSAQEDSSQKDGILASRKADRDAEKNRQHCSKLGFPASGGDNRCFSVYPTRLMTFGKGFNEGLAKVTLNGKVGFIDTVGNLVIPAKFNEAGSFSDGLAPFEDSNRKWGYLDKQGRIAIKPQFDWALGFREGLAAVQIGEKWGFIDRNGELKIRPKYEEVSSFSEGLASVTWLDSKLASASFPEGKWRQSFVDSEGVLRIEGSFHSINRGFSKGIAIVGEPVECPFGSCSESYVIDKTGARLWTLDSWYISWFSDDALIVAAGEDEKGYNLYRAVGDDGKPILENRTFSQLGEFVNGLALARRTWTGKYGFINKKGDFVIEEKYDGGRPFSEGLAAIQTNSKYGYIDGSGRNVIEPRFAYANDFRNGFALVAPTGSGKDTTGYIDKTGKYIWEPTK